MLDDEEMSSGLHYPKSIMQTARIVRCSVTKAGEPGYFQIVFFMSCGIVLCSWYFGKSCFVVWEVRVISVRVPR